MSVLYAFESIRTGFLTVLESIWSFLGEEAFLFAFLAVIYWCVDKYFARRIGFTAILAGNLTMIIKNIAGIPRPWILDSSFRPADSIMLDAEGFAFPSMHTARAVSIAANFFGHYRQKWIKAIAVLVMFLVPVSRLYMGAVSLAGVIVSLVITIVIAFILNKFIDGMVLDRSHYPLFCLGLCGLPIFSFIIFLSQYYNGIIEYSMGVSSVRYAGASIAFALSWMFEIKYVKFNERCDHAWKQLVKAVIGIAIIIVLKVGFDALVASFGTGFWPGEFMEYFIIVFAAMGIYPLVFRKYFSANYQTVYGE